MNRGGLRHPGSHKNFYYMFLIKKHIQIYKIEKHEIVYIRNFVKKLKIELKSRVEVHGLTKNRTLENGEKVKKYVEGRRYKVES